MTRTRSISILLIVLAIKAFVMILWIQFSGLQLAPDEAQYWTWSESLDWGYYSKPPGIAWQIWLTTHFLGDTVLGVRLGAVALAFMISLSIYYLALAAGLQPKTALWAGVISALSPMGFFASYYATTDIGMVLFWTLGSLVLVYALRARERPHYLLLGLFIGLGALFKWPIYLMWLLVLAGCFFVPPFRSRTIFLGFIISCFGLLPSVIWNAARGWPTFRHVVSTIGGGHSERTSLFQGNFWDFFGAQAALLSPVFFLFLIIAFVALFRYWDRIPLPVKFCGLCSLAILIPYQMAALFQKIQGNWCVFVYPMATVFVAWYLCEFVAWGRKWLWIGSALSCLLVVLIFAFPYVQTAGIGPKTPLQVNRMNECMGWDRIAPALEDVDYAPNAQVLMSDSYQLASLLSFYAPGQNRAYFLNLSGRRLNQFSFWPWMEVGSTGLFVTYAETPFDKDKLRDDYAKALKPYFRKVLFVGWAALVEIYGEPGKEMLIFSVHDYNGEVPAKSQMY